jgi:hypothetical protein
MTELCELFFKYRSDKCPKIFHTYSPLYYDILKNNKYDYKNILEIGVGTNEVMKPISGEEYQIGSSLRAWRDFFPNAKIFGLDIRKDVLFNDNRIECYYTDQSNTNELEKTINLISQNQSVENLDFDLIIDDGSHVVDHMILTFNTLKKYLKKGGIYIIEDIKKHEIPIFINLSDENFEILKVSEGNWDWDAFVVFKKNI